MGLVDGCCRSRAGSRSDGRVRKRRIDALRRQDRDDGTAAAVLRVRVRFGQHRVKLVALGDFHVNDEYPYRFKANEAPGVDFGGTDALGKGVFSKSAGDWHKADAKSGVMTVKFTPREKGEKTITGMFKLSVCSAANCLLEQRELTTPVVAR